MFNLTYIQLLHGILFFLNFLRTTDTFDDASLNAPMKPPTGVDANSGAASGMNSVYGQVSFFFSLFSFFVFLVFLFFSDLFFDFY